MIKANEIERLESQYNYLLSKVRDSLMQSDDSYRETTRLMNDSGVKISYFTISEIARGSDSVKIDTLLKIAKFFNQRAGQIKTDQSKNDTGCTG
jgi:hypothetical protein